MEMIKKGHKTGVAPDQELLLALQEKQFTLKDIPEISYRTINHWDSKGFLISNREDKATWRKFSLAEVIWLKMLNDLRRMGVSIECVIDVIKHEFGTVYPEDPI